jgi:hypothetical protein
MGPWGELILDKLNLKIALRELVDLGQGMVSFQEATADVRQGALEFNTEFMRMVRVLHLPWKTELTQVAGEHQIRVDGLDTTVRPSSESATVPKSPQRRTRSPG